MASKFNPPADSVCGGEVKIFYVYRRNLLEYTEIQHENGNTLKGFPKNGHFVAKVTKAIVRTSYPVEMYKAADDCTLNFNRQPGGPRPTTADINIMHEQCEAPLAEKEAQMTAGDTRPVILETVKANNVYTKVWYPKGRISCSYKKHTSRFLKTDLVGATSLFEGECKTANVINFPGPLMLFYGNKFCYQIAFPNMSTKLLDPHPRIVLIFYGRLFETTNKKFTADGLSFFSAWFPPLYEGDRTGSDSESEPTEYESGIDDWGAGAKKNTLKDEALEEETTKSDSDSERSDDEQEDKSKPALLWVETERLGPYSGRYIMMPPVTVNAFHN